MNPSWTLSSQDSALLAQEIANLASAGLPLASGMRALAAEWPNRKIQQALSTIANRLEAGEPFPEIIDDPQSPLPPHWRALLAAGIATGRLDSVLTRHLVSVTMSRDLTRRLRIGIAYPILVAVICSVILVGFCWMMARGFVPIFQDFAIQLPAISRFTVWVAVGMTNIGWRLLLSVPLAIALMWFGWRVLLDPPARSRWLNLMPLFGKLRGWSIFAEFSYLLAGLIEARLPMPQALRLAGAASGDADLERVCGVLASDVEDGENLSEAILNRRVLHPIFCQVLDQAEGTESTVTALEAIGEMFEGLARSQDDFAIAACGLGAFLFVIGTIALAVVSVYLPLMQLISMLSG